MKRFRLVTLALAVTLGALGLGVQKKANAATATSSFTVTADVVASCTISTAGISFGSYDPVVTNHSTPLDANGSVTVACTNGAVTSIGMNQGANQSMTSTAAVPLRNMAAGTNKIRYDLYQDTLHTTVWGDVGTAAAKSYTSTGMAGTTLTIYGRMPSGQDAVTGSYTDTVTATIQF